MGIYAVSYWKFYWKYENFDIHERQSRYCHATKEPNLNQDSLKGCLI